MGKSRDRRADLGGTDRFQRSTCLKLFTALRTIHGPCQNWTEPELFNLAASVAAFKPDATQIELLTELLDSASDLGEMGRPGNFLGRDHAGIR
ncbi:hypothetical protein SV7mr_25900 [Stieleria bergensis]|uniref:Uncharacterized protein n=1 Tax=Stieleria bergensis TaxID=2528025 RepID=A0A517SVF3_9BACT|nr:hypothetical protein SV7mr_25900 [Planctomycetes bacterium SV_7m_r]